MQKNKLPISLFAVALVAGMGAGLTSLVSAQTTTTPTTTSILPIGTNPGPPTQQGDMKRHGHAPLGNDGIVSSINGTSIVMVEEADEGGASYTIDASRAIITNNTGAGTLSDLKVGEKIFVQGTVNGTNVVATSISLGHPGGHGPHGDHKNHADTPAATQ